MNRLPFDIESLRRQATYAARRWSRLDADDLQQETLLRFLSATLSERVDARGSARALAGAVLRNVVRETLRVNKRALAIRVKEDLVDARAISPLQQLIAREEGNKASVIERTIVLWWDGLTERRRLAVVRIARVPLFEYKPDRQPVASDYTAAFRARQSLLRTLAAARHADNR
jgi:DNA-directed RNA polymerase specialized sigma24 family protein